MENKYYTPIISEFFIGFEYEHYNNTCGCWLNSYYGTMYDQRGDEDLDELKMDVERVKYLDQEDIESLGWQYFMTNEEQIVYTKFVSIKRGDFNAYLHHVPYTNWVLIYLEDVVENHTLFAGEIKNKSELSKLLKQLKITDGE